MNQVTTFMVGSESHKQTKDKDDVEGGGWQGTSLK